MALLQPGDLFPNGTASIEFTSGSGTTITPFSQSGNAYVVFETDLINNPNEPTKSLSGATFTSLTASTGAVIDGAGYHAAIVTSPGSSFTFTPSVNIPAGRVLLRATGNIGLDVASFTGLLDTFTATAGYSVRQLRVDATSSLRVRRSSDDTEQDIGFDANGDLDSTALLAFVNADYNTHNSDFSSGTDGWFANGGTADGNIDGVSDGTTSKDDVLRLTLSGGSTNHSVRLNGAIGLGNVHDVSFEYYIPSGQTMDGIKFQTNSGLDGNYQQSVVGTWTSVTISDWSITGGDQFRVYATDGGSITVNGDDDVFYLKNIVVTQTTADGAVTTWYDQSGNNNHATNATESEQPLVVSAGALVTENGKAAVEFDGSSDALEFTQLNLGDNSWFINAVYKSTRTSLEDYLMYGDSGNTRIRIYSTTARIYVSNTSYSYTIDSYRNTQQLFTFEADASKGMAVYQNGTEKGTEQTIATNDSFNPSSLGQAGGSRTIDGLVQEIIIFNSDQSANRTGIETNINTHFSIF